MELIIDILLLLVEFLFWLFGVLLYILEGAVKVFIFIAIPFGILYGVVVFCGFLEKIFPNGPDQEDWVFYLVLYPLLLIGMYWLGLGLLDFLFG